MSEDGLLILIFALTALGTMISTNIATSKVWEKELADLKIGEYSCSPTNSRVSWSYRTNVLEFAKNNP